MLFTLWPLCLRVSEINPPDCAYEERKHRGTEATESRGEIKTNPFQSVASVKIRGPCEDARFWVAGHPALGIPW
jgi:hypothetical protein